MDDKIKLIAVIVSMLVILYFMCGCNVKNGKSRGSSPENYVDLQAKESYELIKQHEGNKGFVILDVRTPKEYTRGHIAHAVNANYTSREFKDMLAPLDKSKTYLVHCRSGNRSLGALKIMHEMGFENVYHMRGGISAWVRAGYPVE
jgi:rhodanese-related sulfurtransferase